MNLFVFPLIVWFFFYLWNHATLTETARNFVYSIVPYGLYYAMTCSFCSTFWVSLIFFSCDLIPWTYLFAAPVINLFIELGFQKLRPTENEPEESGQPLANGKYTWTNGLDCTPQSESQTNNSKSSFFISQTSNDIQTR